MSFATEVQQALAPQANAAEAAGMAAYMKHQFAFLGVKTPLRRALTGPLIRACPPQPQVLLRAARALWALPQREYQYAACDLLLQHRAALGPDDLPALCRLATDKPWWDTVDVLAKVIGDVARRDAGACAAVDELLAAPSMWLRRVALLHQLDWAAATDEARLFAACAALAHEREFFICKAIGWALRQHARRRPQAVQAFVQAHATALAPLSVREACKHIGPRPTPAGAAPPRA